MFNKRFFSWLMALVLVSQLLGGLVPPAMASNFSIPGTPWKFSGTDVSGEPFVVTGTLVDSADNPQPVRVTGFEYAGSANENGLLYESPRVERITIYLPFTAEYGGFKFQGVYLPSGEVIIDRIVETVVPTVLEWTSPDGDITIEAIAYGNNVQVEGVSYDGDETGTIYSQRGIEVPAVTTGFSEQCGEFTVTGYIMLDGSEWWVMQVIREEPEPVVPVSWSFDYDSKTAQISASGMILSKERATLDTLEIHSRKVGVVYQKSEFIQIGFPVSFDAYNGSVDGYIIPENGEYVFMVTKVTNKFSEIPAPQPEPEPAPTPKPIPVPQPEVIEVKGDIVYDDAAGAYWNGIRYRHVLSEKTDYFPAQPLVVPAAALDVKSEYKAKDGLWHAKVRFTAKVDVTPEGAVQLTIINNSAPNATVWAVGADTDGNFSPVKISGRINYSQISSILYLGVRWRLLIVEDGIKKQVVSVPAMWLVVCSEYEKNGDWWAKVSLSCKASSNFLLKDGKTVAKAA